MILKKNVVDRLYEEAEKQECDFEQFARFCSAYDYAQRMSRTLPTELDIKVMGHDIDPNKAGTYRETPVTFPNGDTGMTPDTIPVAMKRLVECFPEIETIEEIDNAVQYFLVIHPFRDGNGRCAFILRTWLMGNWDNPERLPDYFGEKNN